MRTEAMTEPYPYVEVGSDGAVRELHQLEREYLETPFYSSDGGRPFIKPRYSWRNALGDIAGFLERSKVPRKMTINPAPLSVSYTETRADAIAQFRSMVDDLIEHEDGSISYVERKR